MRRNFNFADRKSFSRMTNVDAQEIVTYLAELEFPKIMEMSLQFALFKVSFHLLPPCAYDSTDSYNRLMVFLQSLDYL